MGRSARVALAFVLVALWAGNAAAQDRPNIVLLMAEDLSPRLGAYGDDVARTPNLDRLATEGTRYTRAFTTAGVCAPSRAAILMGVHQNRIGAGHMRSAAGGYVAVPPPDWKGFPELLRRAGYWVVNNGKTDVQMSTTLGGAFGGPESLFDDMNGGDWQGHAEGQPFFAYLTLAGTHESQVWPTWDLFSVTRLLMAPLRIPNHWQWEHETDPATVPLPPYYADTPTARADVARHYNNIAAMDRAGGRADRTSFEARWISDDRTVVIFTTDHGDGLPRAKRWLYGRWASTIPLIVRLAGPSPSPARAVEDSLVSGVDFAPTILAAAGLRSAQLDARAKAGSSWGLAKRPSRGLASSTPHAIASTTATDRVRAVRDRSLQIHPPRAARSSPTSCPIAFRDQMPMMRELQALSDAGSLDPVAAQWFRATRDAEELFDTAADPHEVKNLAADPAHAETLARMRAALDAHLEGGWDLGAVPEAEIAMRFWPNGAQPQAEVPFAVREDGVLRLDSRTEGASILWRERGEEGWTLYTEPFEPPAAGFEAVAVRYGWATSEPVVLR